MEVDFHSLSPGDVAAAAALSDDAGWGMRAADWERLVSLPQVETIGGWIAGSLAATASVVRYGGDVAWIGSVIVASTHRRQGLGTRVFDRALDAATDLGVETVGLDANDTAKPIYARVGFEDVVTATVFSGVPRTDVDTEDVVDLSDVDQVAAYDTRAVGVDRSFLLASLLDAPRTRGFIVPDAGFALRSRTRSGWAVGPLVADDDATARALLAAVAESTRSDPITVNALGDAPASAFRAAGLSPHRTLTRMTYPDAREALTGSHVYANAGFALG